MSAMSQHTATLRRLPLLLLPLAAVSLLSGLLAGLIRMGWTLPTPRACHQLSQTTLATSWTAARKFRAVFS